MYVVSDTLLFKYTLYSQEDSDGSAQQSTLQYRTFDNNLEQAPNQQDFQQTTCRIQQIFFWHFSMLMLTTPGNKRCTEKAFFIQIKASLLLHGFSLLPTIYLQYNSIILKVINVYYISFQCKCIYTFSYIGQTL